MNIYIINQCRNMIASVDLFKKACEIAAGQDDNMVTRDERKIINKLTKASDEYKRQLEKIINQ